MKNNDKSGRDQDQEINEPTSTKIPAQVDMTFIPIQMQGYELLNSNKF